VGPVIPCGNMHQSFTDALVFGVFNDIMTKTLFQKISMRRQSIYKKEKFK